MLVSKMMLVFVSSSENSVTIVAGDGKVKMLLLNMSSNIISSLALEFTF